MPLVRLTITGADDTVDPEDLIALSRVFPFVEWGILGSWSRAGTPRYPSEAWVTKLLTKRQALPLGERPRLAHHLCGSWARKTFAAPQMYQEKGFDRVQLNGVIPTAAFFSQARMRTWVFQALYERELPRFKALAQPASTVDFLFDPSGGRGQSPDRWPSPSPHYTGFAGGIKPSTIRDVVKQLGDRGPYWLDMESGVRDSRDDFFDLGLVQEALREARRVIMGGV